MSRGGSCPASNGLRAAPCGGVTSNHSRSVPPVSPEKPSRSALPLCPLNRKGRSSMLPDSRSAASVARPSCSICTRSSVVRRAIIGSSSSKHTSCRLVRRLNAGRACVSAASSAQTAGCGGVGHTRASASSPRRREGVSWSIWYCCISLYQAISSKMVMPGSWALWSRSRRGKATASGRPPRAMISPKVWSSRLRGIAAYPRPSFPGRSSTTRMV